VRIGIVDHTVCNQGMEMTVEIQLIASGLNECDHAGGNKGPVLAITQGQKHGLFGCLNKEGQEFVAVLKIDA